MLHLKTFSSQQNLAQDLHLLLTRQKIGHMISWEYEDKSSYKHSASGSVLWNKAIRQSSYYMDWEEEKLIKFAIRAIMNLLPPELTFVEFGPGTSSKSFPLIAAVKPSKIIAIDHCMNFLNIFDKSIKLLFSKNVEKVYEDFINKPPFFQEKALIVSFGGTFFNTPICLDSTPDYDAMIQTLKTWKRSLTAGGYILIGQDTNNDPETLNAAYNQPYIKAMTESVWHYAARELDLGTFDPYAMEYRGVWDANNKVFKHMTAPLKSQTIYLNGHGYDLKKSEAFCQSNSIKLSSDEMQDLIVASGMTPVKTWQSPEGRMALHLISTH